MVLLGGLLALGACAAIQPTPPVAQAFVEETCDCELFKRTPETTVSLPAAGPAAPAVTATPSPQPTGAPATPAPAEPTAAPSGTVTRTADLLSKSPTPEWMGLPVLPTVSATAREIYRRGLALGNRPEAFAKVGDCGVETQFFLTDFDGDPAGYDLGPYEALQDTIDYFSGSFSRDSLAAKNGANTAGLFVPLWADREICAGTEGPLACEYRLWQPSIALIMVGTNDAGRGGDDFEAGLRKVVDATIERGIVPVLATKADNLEGDHAINAAIARVAADYDVPLWNFWAAVQDLPRGGLQPDGAHLTFLPNRFGDPDAMQTAWPVRNLTALQVLEALRLNLAEDGS
ncbi:MAG TPA: SGNH/GDSL hydrolase family protein [Anaerolineaceae bacterium]|nr:SGNH/GDSL hydrolase family protein [Anaerolineaceae bacterium]